MKVTILVVDDDPVFGNPLCQRLRRSDAFQATVFYAETASDALEIAQTSPTKFDVFLIDQRLGVELDGIELAERLHDFHPDADFIMFTGLEDAGRKGDLKKAYQAGAYQYLRKPFRFGELEWQLRALLEKRQASQERNWLKILLDIGKKARSCDSNSEFEEIFMKAGLELGYKRARFWQRIEEDLLRCTNCIHPEHDSGPVDVRKKISDLNCGPIAMADLKAHFFPANHDQERTESSSNQDFTEPAGEWVILSLGTGGRCEAMLVFDFAETPRVLSQSEKQFIEILGQQANASLAEMRERQQARQIQLINDLGGEINRLAATSHMQEVLKPIYHAIINGTEAPNVIVAIKNPKTQLVDKVLHMVDRMVAKGVGDEGHKGMIAHLVALGETLLLPFGTEKYRLDNNIDLVDRPAQSWMGVPLQIKGETIGAIVLEDDHSEGTFNERHREFVESIADIAAGAIYTVWLKQDEAWGKEQLRLLHYASEQIIRYADQPARLWTFVLTVLNIICSKESAELFVYLERDGRSPEYIGAHGLKSSEIDDSSLEKYWRNDRSRFELEDFAKHLEEERVHLPKDFNAFVKDYARLDTREIPELEHFVNDENTSHLPLKFADAQTLVHRSLEGFEAEEYVLLSIKPGPLRTNTGLLIIGGEKDFHSNIPIEHLEPFLRQVALAMRTTEDHAVMERFLEIQRITSFENKPGELNLRPTLCKVAEIARQTMGADRVAIHPLLPDTDKFDGANSGYAKRKKYSRRPRKPRVNGLTHRILTSANGLEIISNVHGADEANLGFKIRKEGRVSLIGMRIEEAVTKRPLGVFYADFDFEYKFSDRMVDWVRSFAVLAGEVIIKYELFKAREADFQNSVEARNRILESIAFAQNSGLKARNLSGSELRESVIYDLIKGLQTLLGDHQSTVCLILKERVIDPKTNVSRLIKRHYAHDPKGGGIVCSRDVELNRGLTGKVFQTGEMIYTPDITQETLFYQGEFCANTGSELDLPIKVDDEVIGVWNLEHPAPRAYSEFMREAVSRYCDTSSTVLDSMKRTSQLNAMLDAVEAVTDDIPPVESIEKIGEKVYDALPYAETVTIWYKRHLDDDEHIELGFHKGIKNAWIMRQDPLKPIPQQSMVRDTLKRRSPLWIENVDKEAERLTRYKEEDFIGREGLVSTIHIPLLSEGHVVGAMFLGYRHAKKFSQELRRAILILAKIVAANIRDTVNLANLRRERKRLSDLLEITSSIGDSLEQEKALKDIMRKLKEQYVEESMILYTYDHEKQRLQVLPISDQFFPVDISDKRIAFLDVTKEQSAGLVGEVARLALHHKRSKLINAEDVNHPDYPHYKAIIKSTQSEVAVAFVGKDGLVGVLAIESPHLNCFKAEDEPYLSGVGEILAAVILRERRKQDLDFHNLVASRTAWAAEMAHESKNQIAFILNRTSWLEDEIRENGEGQMWLNEIEESVAELNQLMNDPTDVRYYDFDLMHDLISLVRHESQHIFEKQGHFGKSELDLTGLPEKRIETNNPKVSLNQILKHLISNALEAIEKAFDKKAGGVLRIQLKEISFGADQQAEEVIVSIEDNGSGIDPQLRSQILQSPTSSHEGKKERGHGLIFTRMFVEGLGGKLWLDSEPDEEWTRFAFRIPLLRSKEGDFDE